MSGLQDLYQTVILEEARERRGGDRYGEGGWSGHSHQVNPTCGDELTLGVRLDDDGRIAAIGWEGDGCSISMASASLMTDLLEGRTVAEALELIAEFRRVMHSRGAEEPDPERFGDAVALGGVSRYVMRVKCAMLGWVALEDALHRAEA
ncbi:Fe-S cluster assembly sulfur transfer protein SufU [Pseudoclavibacter caeni]|jgi:nitrogen fixation protein NifU and related proteins|uniref:SUF system NifU family Fe-S cluster assembly protein n=1 Tax=Pseudoclavibacter caeni TaxID=908846 RepID=A0A7C8FR61_9MICO|nr:SUF system NifU family Fe-S cluster assembly protein [Pseudoclavibacter caeni]KAB1632351.1 SUF system NifU family Fe-S cluster assembly protein [Pseudoclavibacter caeni]NYJ97592.1 nitrogen fixation NifU-like protein [Pseudoclavibacter caeni]